MIKLLLALLIALPAFAIVPAKDAAKLTKENKIRLQEEDRKSRVKCLKEWEQEINFRIEDAVSKGECFVNAETKCFWKEESDRAGVQDKFRKAGYSIGRDVISHKGDPYYFIVSWCEQVK